MLSMFASPFSSSHIPPHLPAHPASCSLSVLRNSPHLLSSTPRTTAVATLVKALLRKPFHKYQSGRIHSCTKIHSTLVTVILALGKVPKQKRVSVTRNEGIRSRPPLCGGKNERALQRKSW